MKSSCNKSVAALVSMLAIAALGSPVLLAGVEKTADKRLAAAQIEHADDIKPQPNGKEMPTSSAKSVRNRSDSEIKCWQEGRLLLDERNWEMQGAGVSGTDLQSAQGRFAKLKLMQFGDTFCMLKYDAQ